HTHTHTHTYTHTHTHTHSINDTHHMHVNANANANAICMFIFSGGKPYLLESSVHFYVLAQRTCNSAALRSTRDFTHFPADACGRETLSPQSVTGRERRCRSERRDTHSHTHTHTHTHTQTNKC